MRRMDTSLPSSPALVGLVLATPFVAYAGAWVTSRAAADAETRRVLTPAAGMALWLLAIETVARVFHHFITGLVVGTLAVALVGVAHIHHRLSCKKQLLPLVVRHKIDVVVAFCSFVVIVPAVNSYVHDELSIGGHLSLVGQLENGIFPPRFLQFPSYELPYHFGFNVIAAAWGTMLRLSPARAIDLTTTLGWLYTAWLGCFLGRRLGGARWGAIAGLLVLFGGGIHWGCAPDRAPLGYKIIGFCSVDEMWLNPPLGSYFFQHPLSLGIPFFLAIPTLLADRALGARWQRYALFALLFAALSQTQFVLFLCGSTSFIVAETFHEQKIALHRAAGAITCVLCAWVIAAMLGGFLTPTPYRTQSTLMLHWGVTDHLWGTLIWTARSYGVLLPIGLVGIYRMRREKLFIGLVTCGALLVPNVFRYRFSWDIVKFGTVAMIALALGTASFCTQLVERYRTGRFGSAFSKIVAGGILVGGIGWSMSYHAAAWLGIPKTGFDEAPIPIEHDDAFVITYLRRHMKPGEGVYRSLVKAKAYSQWGGLATSWPEDAAVFGFDAQVIAKRKRLLKTLPPDAAEYVAQGIVWFVLDASDARLREHGDNWVQEGLADVMLKQGNLLVLRLRPALP